MHGGKISSMDNFERISKEAVKNLLFHCAEGKAGQSLLIVHESNDQPFYDPLLPPLLSKHARELGFHVTFEEIAFDPDVKDPDPQLVQAMRLADHTLFLARLGDQIRFRPGSESFSKIISYAIDSDMLASDFGIADYRGFEALKAAINKVMANASSIHVSCPAGTDFSGHIKNSEQVLVEVEIKRFPMSIFTPVPTLHFSGRIAQNGFLVGTGSQYYTPYACALKETLFVDFEGNSITEFRGCEEDISTAENHYKFVAKKYGIDPYFVHSWHAGIHPACQFTAPASESFERWSGSAFGNPRLLHFHTCGEYPPGEISLNIVDPTIVVDGEALWESGQLHPNRLPGGSSILCKYPTIARIFESPSSDIGLAQNGRLSYT